MNWVLSHSDTLRSERWKELEKETSELHSKIGSRTHCSTYTGFGKPATLFLTTQQHQDY